MSKQGMNNVTHSPVKFGEPTPDMMVEIQVDDATDRMFFSQNVLEIEDGDGVVVSITSGTGLGGDFIVMTYKHSDGTKRHGVAYMREVALEWIGKIDPSADTALLKMLIPDRS